MVDQQGALSKLGFLLNKLTETPNSDIPDIVVGTVVRGDPEDPLIEMTITAPNGESAVFKLDKSYLIIGTLCIESWIPKMWFDEQTHTHDYHHGTTSPEIGQIQRIRRWRGLRPGDKVYMLKLRRGQLYYVIQRVEGVIDN